MASDDRKYRRYPVTLPVVLLMRSHEVAATAHDVSLRGLFLRMPSPPGQLQLLRMKTVLPPHSTELIVLGVGRNVVDASAAGRTPGTGVEFFGLDGAPRKAWEAFIHHVEQTHKAAEQVAALDPSELELDYADLEYLRSMPPAA